MSCAVWYCVIRRMVSEAVIFQHGGNYSPDHIVDLPEYLILQQRCCKNSECCKMSSLMNEVLFNVKLFLSFSWICMTVRRKLIYMFCAVGVKSLSIFWNNMSFLVMFLYWSFSCGKLVKRHKHIAINDLFLEHLNWILYCHFETKQRRLVMGWFEMVTQVGNALEWDCGKCWHRLVILQFTVMNLGLLKLESSCSV